jgi:hypothetical protein
VTTAHYTALPLATLTLTAHTRPAQHRTCAASDRTDHRSNPDPVRPEPDHDRAG